jgi:hypothetical protein
VRSARSTARPWADVGTMQGDHAALCSTLRYMCQSGHAISAWLQSQCAGKPDTHGGGAPVEQVVVVHPVALVQVEHRVVHLHCTAVGGGSPAPRRMSACAAGATAPSCVRVAAVRLSPAIMTCNLHPKFTFLYGTLAVDRPSFVIGAPARMAFSLVALVIVMKDPAYGRHAAVSHRLSDHSA